MCDSIFQKMQFEVRNSPKINRIPCPYLALPVGPACRRHGNVQGLPCLPRGMPLDVAGAVIFAITEAVSATWRGFVCVRGFRGNITELPRKRGCLCHLTNYFESVSSIRCCPLLKLLLNLGRGL